jgi:hypothetical protein
MLAQRHVSWGKRPKRMNSASVKIESVKLYFTLFRNRNCLETTYENGGLARLCAQQLFNLRIAKRKDALQLVANKQRVGQR